MTHDSGLPFALTGEALAEWLDLLGKLPPSRAASQLNQALKQLKSIDDGTAVLLPLLIDLTPLTLSLAENLSNALLADAKAAEKTAKAAKLSMQLPRQLGLIFCQLAEGGLLTGSDLQSAIYYALQLVGQCLRLYALHYEMPSATLWKKSASLYQLAISHGYLTTRLDIQVKEFKTQPHIQAVIKRNLLFSVSNPRLYDRQEIKQFFILADQWGPKLEIGSVLPMGSFNFHWDLNGEAPPCPVTHIDRPLPAGFIGINTHAIGRALQTGEASSELTPNIQNKLALHLTGYEQVFSSIIPGLPSRSDLILGFPRICAYLQEQNKLAKIRQLSAQISGAQLPKRNMSLVPKEHERNVFETADQPFGKPSQGRTINILKCPNPNFAVAEGRKFDCPTGDIAMLYKEQRPNSLVIIRQQSQHDLSGSTHILLEKIAGYCELYTYSTSSGLQQAIVLGEDSANPEVFLAGGKYNIDSKLELNTGRSLRLTACLEANAFFARFRVSFDS